MSAALLFVFGVAFTALGFVMGWTAKPQRKEIMGSVRGPHGKFVKRDHP